MNDGLWTIVAVVFFVLVAAPYMALKPYFVPMAWIAGMGISAWLLYRVSFLVGLAAFSGLTLLAFGLYG